MSPDLRDRFRGALIGTAVGDALGAHFEGWPLVPDDKLEPLADRLSANSGS